MTCIDKEGKKFCEVIEKSDTLYISVPENYNGYPSDSWLAISGIPPDLESYSSTHIFEASTTKPDIAMDLARLSNQKDWIDALRRNR